VDEGRALTDVDRCLDRGLSDAEATPACEGAAAASSLDPSQQAALAYRRGQIALGQDRPVEASVFLEEARRLEPTVAPYLLTLGDALVASGDRARAIAVYREGQRVASTSKVFGVRLEGLGVATTGAAPAVAQR
jgi:hypothetical protein